MRVLSSLRTRTQSCSWKAAASPSGNSATPTGIRSRRSPSARPKSTTLATVQGLAAPNYRSKFGYRGRIAAWHGLKPSVAEADVGPGAYRREGVLCVVFSLLLRPLLHSSWAAEQVSLAFNVN